MLQDLPAAMYKTLIEPLLSDLELKRLRQVSKGCKYLVDSNIVALYPRDFSYSQDGDLVRLFPNIESLDARRWTQATLPEDSLEPEDAIGQQSRYEQLTALTRLTPLIMHRSAGWGALRMQMMEGLTGLSILHYEDARDVTNESLDALSCLVSLRELSLTGASGGNGEGLASLKGLLHLQSLDVSGWGKKNQDSSEALQAIASLTQLTALSAKSLVRSVQAMEITAPNQPNKAVTHFRPLLSESLGPLSFLTGLQKLDLGESVIPSEDILGQLTGLSRLTCLCMGARKLLDERVWILDVPLLEGSALLDLRELRVLDITGWCIHFAPRAASSRGSSASNMALTELHITPWKLPQHEPLLHAAIRGGLLEALQVYGSTHPNLNHQRPDIPHIWTQATTLTRLEFCGIKVMSLSELQTLHMLKSLVFSTCMVSGAGVARHVSSRTTLEVLRFNNSTLIPTTLEVLQFNNSTLIPSRGGYLLAAGDLSRLKVLQLPKTEPVTQELVGQVAQLSNLRDLDLSSDMWDEPDIQPLSALTQLTRLLLPNSYFASISGDAELNVIRNFRQLRVLKLDNGRFSDAGLSMLTGLSKLWALSMRNCPNITEAGAEDMGLICCTVVT